MTTIYDDVLERLARLGPITLEQGVEDDINADPTGVFPRFDDWNSTSIPKVAFGAAYSSLNLGGGFSDLSVNLGTQVPSQQTKNRATVTASGHSLEMDDTPGNERVILKHRSGNGVEVKSDGSMILAAGDQIISVTRDQKIIIEGNATLIYGGDLDMQVAGDYNLSVAGNYNLSVNENRTETTEGSYRTTTEGNEGRIVKGNDSKTVLGTSTDTVLGDKNSVTKGKLRMSAQDDMRIAGGANTTISSKTNLYQSSTNMNLAASSMSVFGATGTFGGEGVVFYGNGGSFNAGVTAPTFHGDLDGTATASTVTQSQTYGEGSTGSAGSITNTATPTTSEPTSSVLNDYLNNTPYGAVDVKVDVGNHILNAINKSTATSGLSKKELTTSEVRALLRTEGVRSDTSFVGNAVSTGKLSPAFARQNPPEVRRLASSKQEAYRGNNRVGSALPGLDTKFLAADDLTNYNFTTSVIIDSQTVVQRSTKVAEGISLGVFLGKHALGKLSEVPIADRSQIVRNLQPNAELVKRIRSNSESEFKNHRLVVAEGVYKPTDAEVAMSGWQDSINRYRSEGRAVVYELHDGDGNIDVEKTFDLAVYLKTVTSFEKMILDYDSYNTDGSLNTQLIFITPSLDQSYNPTEGTWSKSVETKFNGKVITNSDLIEFNEEEFTLL